MKSIWQKVQKNWDRFWFEASAIEQLSLLRISAGLILFCFYCIRVPDLHWLFSESGLMSYAVITEALPFPYRFTLLQYFRSDLAIYVLHAIFLISLLGVAWGRYAKVFTAVAFILHISFLHRNVLVIFGADSVATFVLFYLALASFKPFHSVAYRLMQIQVCIIYIYSGLEKLKGVSWWKGEAVWGVIANPQFARVDMTWVSNFPLVISVVTYLTLLWEIYFVVLVWIPSWRRFMLIFGVAFHLGIGFMVNIPYFSLIMIAAYSVFLTRKEASSILLRIKLLKTLRFSLPDQSRNKI